MSRSRRKRKYSGSPCRCWLCSPSERVRAHRTARSATEIREGNEDVHVVAGMRAGPTPAARAKETLALLLEGRHEELAVRARDAWDRALSNARQQRD